MLHDAPEQAQRMLTGVVRLDYNRLDDRVVGLIEDAVCFAMIGEKRAEQQPENAPLAG